MMIHDINITGSGPHDSFIPNKKGFVELLPLCNLSVESGYFLDRFLVVGPDNMTTTFQGMV